MPNKSQPEKQCWMSNKSNKFKETIYPEYTRLLPCPSDKGPPKIEHLVVSEGGTVQDYICKFVADLIHFGTVFYALVCPWPPPTANPEHMRVYKEVTAPSVLKDFPDNTSRPICLQVLIIIFTSVIVVHMKILIRCYEIDWKSRIVAVTDGFVVLDKPAGTTVPNYLLSSTTGNIEESCATFATRAFGMADSDNSEAEELLCCFQPGACILAAAPVPIGTITRYMRPVKLAPRLISEGLYILTYHIVFQLSWCIGLQACQISWDDGNYTFEAGAPWWRCQQNLKKMPIDCIVWYSLLVEFGRLPVSYASE
ncbi:unnamed protein product [Malus baccata var. baccata]